MSNTNPCVLEVYRGRFVVEKPLTHSAAGYWHDKNILFFLLGEFWGFLMKYSLWHFWY